MTTSYDDLTMRAARDRYFADNGFGPTGGYDDKWVELHLGPMTVPFPNSKGRAKAVPYHDLHHIVTGYGTDFASETLISAWEIGAGCGTAFAVWVINLSAFGAGLFSAPRRTFAAFRRGRRSASLYDQAIEPLLAATVTEVRTKTGTPAADEVVPVRLGDVAALSAATLGSLVAMPLVTAGTLALMPFGLVALAARKARQRA